MKKILYSGVSIQSNIGASRLRVCISAIAAFSAICFSSCNVKPSLVEQRKAEIREHDSLELVQARADLAVADSVIAFKAFELEDLKDGFVFEKEEKYQTVGYYVLPSYAGNKSRFMFFPEVEETGKLLLVSIDKQRKYTFTEVAVDDEDYTTKLPANLSDAMLKDIDKCYSLAKTMQDLEKARTDKEKMELKVQFYEKKMEKMEMDNGEESAG